MMLRSISDRKETNTSFVRMDSDDRKRIGFSCSNSSSLTTRFCIIILLCFSCVPSCLAVRKTRLTWVNGVAYSLEHMDEGKGKISKLFGGKSVEYCHNPTAKKHDDDTWGYLGDLTQASTQKLGRITPEVDELVRHLKESVAAVGSKGVVVHIAHSQGALVTHLASKRLSPLEMSQIEVITFGGAASLRKTAKTPFSRCVNYYSVNDPLLFLVPEAAHALQSGFVGDDEFCFLSPKLGDPIGDHDLLGPTYGTALAWEGKRFQNKYHSLIYKTVRPACLLLLAVVQAILRQLREALRAILRRTILPLVRCVLFLCAWIQLSSKLQRALVLAKGLLALVQAMVRSCTGEEEYEPVPQRILNQN